MDSKLALYLWWQVLLMYVLCTYACVHKAPQLYSVQSPLFELICYTIDS